MSKVVNKKKSVGDFMELINQIFAKENVNSGRQMEIDLAKGFRMYLIPSSEDR